MDRIIDLGTVSLTVSETEPLNRVAVPVPPVPPNSPPAFHLLAKPRGAICNLDCKYCFYLAKEDLYTGSKFRMSDEMLETYIRQLIEAHRVPEVTVAWQGGEPTLMGLDFFRRSIEYEKKYCKPGMKILNTIQTNGTLSLPSTTRTETIQSKFTSSYATNARQSSCNSSQS